jgi:hypothetical protein
VKPGTIALVSKRGFRKPEFTCACFGSQVRCAAAAGTWWLLSIGAASSMPTACSSANGSVTKVVDGGTGGAAGADGATEAGGQAGAGATGGSSNVGGTGGSSAAGASGTGGRLDVDAAVATDGPAGTGGTADAASDASSIFRPALNTSWQWQLTGTIDTSVDAQMFDIDLFDVDASVVKTLHDKGAKVVCYMSAGSYENWRPDQTGFPASVQGQSNGWPGEKWLDVRKLDLLGPIMGARLDLCRSKGFDGVEFDNVDGYANSTGFPLTAADQLTYNRFLATQAHARGLSAGLKNDLEQIPDLLGDFDWALNEQCFEYTECDALKAFVSAGKAVFNVEYDLPTTGFCPQANALNFNSMKKNLALDSPRWPCR